MEDSAPPSALGAKRALQILAAFLGTQLAVAVGAGLYAARRGQGVGTGFALGASLVGTLLGGLVALRMVRVTFARPGGDDARVAMGWTGAPVRRSALAALQGFALLAVFAVIGGLLPGLPRELGPLARAPHAGSFARAAWTVLAIVLAPPLEELIFRGVLYGGLARRWRPRVAGVVTTVLFVALHVTELGTFVQAWLVIAALGLLTLRARVATGSLVPAIALHASYNLGLVVLVYAR